MEPIVSADGTCVALEGKCFKALPSWGNTFDSVSYTHLAHVYLACDADPRLTDPLRALCAEKAIPCDLSLIHI